MKNKLLTIAPDVIIIAYALAGLCKGSTADSDSVCEGSNPSPAANCRRLCLACGNFLYSMA